MTSFNTFSLFFFFSLLLLGLPPPVVYLFFGTILDWAVQGSVSNSSFALASLAFWLFLIIFPFRFFPLSLSHSYYEVGGGVGVETE